MTEDYKSTVKLIVKASNQQHPDQVVECSYTWTILNLKTHLSETYPSKPTIPEQKLIYAGQLLTDKLILRDILRNYDDIEPTNHIFHLVYTPKQRQMSSSSQSNSKTVTDSVSNGNNLQTDGLRQRIIQSVQGANSSTANNPQQTANINNETNNCPPPFGFGNGADFSNPNIMAHQIAMQTWIQQTYAQYINQYMNQYFTLYGSGVPPTTSGVNMPQFPFVPYSAPAAPIPNLPNVGATSTNQQPNIGATNPQIVNPVNTGIAANNNNAAPQAPQQAAAPRFPQIVQEEQENRDWLDTFYSLSRLLVLLILVYFYSSPLRCLAVLFLGVMIYLYHVGFFRNHFNIGGGVEANNNIRNNRNNNQQQPQHQQQPENQQEGGEPGAQINGGVIETAATDTQNATGDNTTGSVASNNVNDINQNDGTSVIAFLRSFLVSFLTSILPEAPAL